MPLVYLMRHGEADYKPIRERGWPGAAADLAPLSRLGVEQALSAADDLVGAGITAVVASPMTRALQTAAIVAVRLGLPLTVQFDLREWLPDDTFSWRSVEDVRAAVDDFDAHGGEWPAGTTRSWEPLSQLQGRCSAALRTAVDGLPGHEVIIVVCHGMVIWSLTGERETRPAQWRTIRLPDDSPDVAPGDPLPAADHERLEAGEIVVVASAGDAVARRGT
jgi:broad specificity phosphatase PhoE